MPCSSTWPLKAMKPEAHFSCEPFLSTLSKKQAPGDLMCCSQQVSSQLSPFLWSLDLTSCWQVSHSLQTSVGGRTCEPPSPCFAAFGVWSSFSALEHRDTPGFGLEGCGVKAGTRGGKCPHARQCFQSYWSIWFGFINYSERVTQLSFENNNFSHNKMACYVSLQ